MRAQDLIKKKRDSGVLTKAEIQFLVEGYTSGRIPDYQMSSLLMSVVIKGMDIRETFSLTRAMA